MIRYRLPHHGAKLSSLYNALVKPLWGCDYCRSGQVVALSHQAGFDPHVLSPAIV